MEETKSDVTNPMAAFLEEAEETNIVQPPAPASEVATSAHSVEPQGNDCLKQSTDNEPVTGTTQPISEKPTPAIEPWNIPEPSDPPPAPRKIATSGDLLIAGDLFYIVHNTKSKVIVRDLSLHRHT